MFIVTEIIPMSNIVKSTMQFFSAIFTGRTKCPSLQKRFQWAVILKALFNSCKGSVGSHRS